MGKNLILSKNPENLQEGGIVTFSKIFEIFPKKWPFLAQSAPKNVIFDRKIGIFRIFSAHYFCLM